MSFAGSCGSARDREAKLGCCVVRRHLTEDQVEALEIELSDALARTLDEIKD